MLTFLAEQDLSKVKLPSTLNELVSVFILNKYKLKAGNRHFANFSGKHTVSLSGLLKCHQGID